jgi:predicted MFS family arabinose efflux permease
MLVNRQSRRQEAYVADAHQEAATTTEKSDIIALYLNVFVFIVQAFMKVPVLKAMASTQSEPPFLVAQLVALALFVVLGIFAVRRFRNEPVPAA